MALEHVEPIPEYYRRRGRFAAERHRRTRRARLRDRGGACLQTTRPTRHGFRSYFGLILLHYQAAVYDARDNDVLIWKCRPLDEIDGIATSLSTIAMLKLSVVDVDGNGDADLVAEQRVDESPFSSTRVDKSSFSPTRVDESSFSPTRVDESSFSPTRVDESSVSATRVDESSVSPTRFVESVSPTRVVVLQYEDGRDSSHRSKQHLGRLHILSVNVMACKKLLTIQVWFDKLVVKLSLCKAVSDMEMFSEHANRRIAVDPQPAKRRFGQLRGREHVNGSCLPCLPWGSGVSGTDQRPCEAHHVTFDSVSVHSSFDDIGASTPRSSVTKYPSSSGTALGEAPGELAVHCNGCYVSLANVPVGRGGGSLSPQCDSRHQLALTIDDEHRVAQDNVSIGPQELPRTMFLHISIGFRTLRRHHRHG